MLLGTTLKTYTFNKNKYKTELLVDVARTSELKSFNRTDKPYIVDFYEILIVTHGKAEVWIDQYKVSASAGTVLFTSPHSIRQTVFDHEFEASIILFDPMLFLGLINDSEFLHRFRFFHSTNGELALHLEHEQHTKVAQILNELSIEISRLSADSEHYLRALVYQLLVLLNRWFVQEKGQKQDSSSVAIITKFRALLERNFSIDGSVSFYASSLNISNNYLNAICKRNLGRNVKALIEERRLREACKLLMYTNDPVKSIAFSLGYNDYSYFCRRFKKHFNETAGNYRRKTTHKQLR